MAPAGTEIHLSASQLLMGGASFVAACAVALIGYQFRTMIGEIKASIKELYDSRNEDRKDVAKLRTDFEKLLVEHKMTHRWDGQDRRNHA
jgi:hypothetical protein